VSWFEGHPTVYRVMLILYYVAVITILIAMYGRGDFRTPPFVYQGF
jgi:cytochrome bd-type quinol oxidase subunit 2